LCYTYNNNKAKGALKMDINEARNRDIKRSINYLRSLISNSVELEEAVKEIIAKAYSEDEVVEREINKHRGFK
jgi:hypothetical protein